MKPKSIFPGKRNLRIPSAGLVLLAMIAFGACSRTVYVPMLQPAPVAVGHHIQSLAIVDRTTLENGDESTPESIITGSNPALNREAAQRSIDGLVRALDNTSRFTAVRTAERLTTPARRGNWPPPISWEEVEFIAAKYNTDAVLVLESFNSEFILTDGATSAPAPGRGEILGRRFYAGGVAGIKLGFRLYDPRYKAITDEYMFDHKSRVEAEGNAIQMVVGGVIDHKMAVNDAGFQCGIIYAERITPRWLRLNRDFFTKGRGNRDFKIGVRRATVNDWEGAREAWHQSVNSRRRKTAGRSAYNLALMYEIAGELDIAREWAQHSYTDYRIKQARQYVSRLDRRIREQRIVDSQMQ